MKINKSYDELVLEINHKVTFLFPNQHDLLELWFTSKNRAFSFRTPLSVMTDGIEGAMSVLDYLNLHMSM